MTADPSPRSSPFAHVGVIGCGLIGGSFALAASRVEGVERVVVHDVDRDALEVAAERGLEATDEPESLASTVDLLVIAVPVPTVAEVAARVAPHLREEAVLTDVGSVKEDVVRRVEALAALEGPGGHRFVGGHPMAGTEGEGIRAAEPTLLQGAVHVLTPTARTDGDALRRLSAFLRLLGCRVLAVDPRTHDRVVATVSHLPHIIAGALVTHAARSAEDDPGVLAVAGGSFRDVTRVAASSPDLWVGILRENRAAVLDALTSFGSELEVLRSAVEEERWEEFRAILEAARTTRAHLPGKEVSGTPVAIVVPVADHPGALAQVATALGEAGINIEDLSMRHAEAADRGALVVTVLGRDAAEGAQAILRRHGLPSHLEDVR